MDVKPVTRFLTPDGREWTTRNLAEWHATGLKLQSRLAAHPDIMSLGAEACLHVLSGEKDMRDLLRLWIQQCEHVENEAKRELQKVGG